MVSAPAVRRGYRPATRIGVSAALARGTARSTATARPVTPVSMEAAASNRMARSVRRRSNAPVASAPTAFAAQMPVREPAGAARCRRGSAPACQAWLAPAILMGSAPIRKRLPAAPTGPVMAPAAATSTRPGPLAPARNAPTASIRRALFATRMAVVARRMRSPAPRSPATGRGVSPPARSTPTARLATSAATTPAG